MAQDGTFRGAGSAVVHQLRPSVQSPQRCGAHLIRGGVSSALHGNAIAGAESVQQEIAVRVDQLVSQSFGYLELPTIDLGSGRRSPDGSDVALAAADLRKDLLAGACAVILAGLLGFNRVEWAILVITIALVLVAEGLNSAIERAIDTTTPGFHPLAKAAKDIGAAAVLIAAIASVVVGLLLYVPKLWALLSAWH